MFSKVTNWPKKEMVWGDQKWTVTQWQGYEMGTTRRMPRPACQFRNIKVSFLSGYNYLYNGLKFASSLTIYCICFYSVWSWKLLPGFMLQGPYYAPILVLCKGTYNIFHNKNNNYNNALISNLELDVAAWLPGFICYCF